MRVVVVGGTGVISSSLVKALLQSGHAVTVFNRGQRAGALPQGVRCLRGDRRDRPVFEAAMQDEHFDIAIEMLCFTAEDAASSLRAFRGVKQLIHTSTCATFGGPLAQMPADETTPLHPNTDYGRNKMAADELVLAAYQRGEIAVTVFKPYYIWAPGMFICRQLGQDRRWIDRMRRGLPLLVTGGGQLLMHHCHADDVAIAYAASVDRACCLGQTYIVTSPHPMTWQDYHERIGAALGCTVTLVDAPADLLLSVWPQNTGLLAWETQWSHVYCLDKIRRDIPEFRPRITLEDGIAPCIAWMEANGLVEDALSDRTEDDIIARWVNAASCTQSAIGGLGCACGAGQGGDRTIKKSPSGGGGG